MNRFEEAAGFRLSAWDARKLGAAAMLLDDLDSQLAARQLQGLSVHAGKLAKAMETIFPVAAEPQ